MQGSSVGKFNSQHKMESGQKIVYYIMVSVECAIVASLGQIVSQQCELIILHLEG